MNLEQMLPLRRRAAVHAALGDPARLAMVDALLLGEASPSELQGLLALPSNLVAHHVGVLERAGVVVRHRSEGDRRRTYLALASGTLEALRPVQVRGAVRVVFVCRANSARSRWPPRCGTARAGSRRRLRALGRLRRCIRARWPRRGAGGCRSCTRRRGTSMPYCVRTIS
jgi:DNA-binding transcriptional ArsR family regulator